MEACYIHTRVPAIHACEVCGEPLCETCRAKDREQVVCYLCVTRLEPLPPPEPTPHMGVIDEVFPDVYKPGISGDVAAVWRGVVLGIITACIVGAVWGAVDGVLGRTLTLAWPVAGVPVGIAVLVGMGGRGGWMPLTVGWIIGILLLMVHSCTLAYVATLANPEGHAHFARYDPLTKVLAVIVTAIYSYSEPRFLFFGLLTVLVTAAVATGLKFRR